MRSRKELFISVVEVVLPTLALYWILKSGVSRQAQQDLKERAGNACESCKINGSSVTLEISHKKHGKTKHHEKLSNLELLCAKCHFIEHEENSRNGLNKAENQFALNQTWNRMTVQQRREVIAMGYLQPESVKKNNKYKNRSGGRRR